LYYTALQKEKEMLFQKKKSFISADALSCRPVYKYWWPSRAPAQSDHVRSRDHKSTNDRQRYTPENHSYITIVHISLIVENSVNKVN